MIQNGRMSSGFNGLIDDHYQSCYEQGRHDLKDAKLTNYRTNCSL
jgi:hypothetical protein